MGDNLIELKKLKLSDYIKMKNFTATKEYNSKQGIYFLYNKHKELMYIGKAKNIGCRIMQHKDNYKTKIHYCYFKYTELICPADRDIYETYYINKLKPPLNKAKVYLYKSQYEELRYFSEYDLIKKQKLKKEIAWAYNCINL